MKSVVKWLCRAALRDYQINYIYCRQLPAQTTTITDSMPASARVQLISSRAEFDEASDERIKEHAWYFGEHAFVYGVFEATELVSICAFWNSAHPQLPDRFGTLDANEAVMVDLLTAPSQRGKGYALALTQFAEMDLTTKGYRKLWTWVWHSNEPSRRVFEKCGWTCVHKLVEIRPYGFKRPFTFALQGARVASRTA